MGVDKEEIRQEGVQERVSEEEVFAKGNRPFKT